MTPVCPSKCHPYLIAYTESGWCHPCYLDRDRTLLAQFSRALGDSR